MKSNKNLLIATIALSFVAVFSIIGIGGYVLVKDANKPEPNTNTYQQKDEQISKCVRDSAPITTESSLEENYRKKQEYCANLYR